MSDARAVKNKKAIVVTALSGTTSQFSKENMVLGPTKAVRAPCCRLHDLNDDVLSRIFRAAIGRPSHYCYPNLIGTVEDPEDDCFGDRRGVVPTQNPRYMMVFTLPQVCRRWRNVMEKYPSIWARASVTVRSSRPSTVVPLAWWSLHASRLESLYLDGHCVEGLGSLSAMHVGILSLLSVRFMRELCLVDCFDDGASGAVIFTIRHLTYLRQLQVYRANPSFINNLHLLTNLKCLKVLELGCCQGKSLYPYVELSTSNFPECLQQLALCEVLLDMEVTRGDYLTNLKSLKLMSTAASGRFCHHLGNLPNLTRLSITDSLVEGNDETNPFNTDFLPDDLQRLSALQSIKELSIQGLECGQRGYFEWMGEEVLREPPFQDIENLSLSFHSLGILSDKFDAYQNLKSLFIEDIRFETIPDPILRLQHLERLEMISCEIATFPETAPCCSKTLNVLNLCGNKLKTIPKALTNWSRLQVLDITLNPLMDFANIDCLLRLPDLRTVLFMEGERSLNLATLDSFSHEFANTSAALKLGYVCAKLHDKKPSCRVYL